MMSPRAGYYALPIINRSDGSLGSSAQRCCHKLSTHLRRSSCSDKWQASAGSYDVAEATGRPSSAVYSL